MRIIISLSLVLCCCPLALPAREEYKRDFQKTAALPAGRTLRVEHSLGSVNVRTQAKNEVAVQAAIRCSADTAEQRAPLLRPDPDPGGGERLRSDHPHRVSAQRKLAAQHVVFGEPGNSDAGDGAAGIAQSLRQRDGAETARGGDHQQRQRQRGADAGKRAAARGELVRQRGSDHQRWRRDGGERQRLGAGQRHQRGGRGHQPLRRRAGHQRREEPDGARRQQQGGSGTRRRRRGGHHQLWRRARVGREIRRDGAQPERQGGGEHGGGNGGLADFVRCRQVHGNRQGGSRGGAEFGRHRRYGGRDGDGADQFRERGPARE